MGGFAPLPQHGGGAAAGLAFATALRAEAAKQQQQAQTQNQQMLKDQFETELKLRKDGYTPYMQQGETKPSGLKTRDPQPGVDPSQVIRDHFGRQWVAPPTAPDATPQQTYTDTSSLLEKGARPVDAGGNVPQDTNTPRYRQAPADAQGNPGAVTDTGLFGINAPPPAGTTVTPPGGKQSYFVPPPDETLRGKLRAENEAKAAQAAKGDGTNYTLPDSISGKWEEKSGLPPGTLKGLSVPRGELRSIITGLADKTEKNPLPHIISETNDAGDVTSTAFDAQTGEKKWSNVQKGIGKKRVDMQAPAPPLGGATGAQKTGDEYLQGLPAGTAAQVRGIAEGRTAIPSGSARSPQAQQLRNAVFQYDPGFSEQRAQVRRAFATGTDGKNIGALNTAIVHLGRLGDTAEALNNGSFTPGNELFNYVKDKFGSAATTNFGLLKDASIGEMATSLKGVATDQEIAHLAQSMRRSNSPEQMHGIVSEGMAILKDKANTYDERYHAVLPDDPWSPILPSAKAQLQKHGLAKGAAGAGQTGQGGYITNRTYGGKVYLGGDPNSAASWK